MSLGTSRTSHQLMDVSQSSSSTLTASNNQVKATETSSNVFTNPLVEGDKQNQDEVSPLKPAYVPRNSRLKHLIRSKKPQPAYSFDYSVEELFNKVTDYSPGYGKVAASMNLDPGFLVMRKFGWLRIYVLLYQQDELQELEEHLEAHDKRENDADGDRRRKSRRVDALSTTSRRDLISDIRKKLIEFDEMLLHTQSVQAMKRPLDRYQNSVKGIVVNDANILDSEASWFRRSDDLVCVAQDAEHGWLNGFVEDAIAAIFSRTLLLKFFRSKEGRQKTGNIEQLDLVSTKRIDALISTIVTLVASVELLVPLLILYKLQQTADPVQMERQGYYQIITIFISTLLFSVSLSIFTTAKRNEIFVAMAGYCAVQVVFVGNSNNATALLAGGVKQPAPS